MYNTHMIKKLLIILLITLPMRVFADSIPTEFVVQNLYEGVWQYKNTYIYKTLGHRNEVIFVSGTCKNKEYTPWISNDGNVFVDTDYSIISADVGLSLSVISKNKCFVSGIYQRIK